MKLLYTFLFLSSLLASEPFVYWQRDSYIHIVDVDPSEVEIVIAKSPAGAEPVSSMALHHRADVAINGGFFRKEPCYGAALQNLIKVIHN